MMKKLLILLGAGALMLGSCTQTKESAGRDDDDYSTSGEFSLRVTVPEQYKGTEVLLLNAQNRDTLGLKMAKDTVVTFQGEVDKPVMAMILVGGLPLNQVVVEPGDISFNEQTYAVGTPTNDAFAKYMTQTLKFIDEAQNAPDDVVQDSIIDHKMVPAAVEFVKAHPNNLYNQVVFQQFGPFYTADQLQVIFDNDTIVAADKEAQHMLLLAKNKANTEDGNKYVDVDVVLADGSKHKLSEWITPGRYTILDFWASWCAPCRQEIPGLVEIYKQYHDAGIDVVGVAVWDDVKDTQKAVKELGIPYPVIEMPKAASQSVAEAYGVVAIPTILMIDPAGKIVGRDLRGEQVKEAVQKAIMSKRR